MWSLAEVRVRVREGHIFNFGFSVRLFLFVTLHYRARVPFSMFKLIFEVNWGSRVSDIFFFFFIMRHHTVFFFIYFSSMIGKVSKDKNSTHKRQINSNNSKKCFDKCFSDIGGVNKAIFSKINLVWTGSGLQHSPVQFSSYFS